MRRVVRTVSLVLVLVALGAAGAAWFTPTPELDAEDASDLAHAALTEADVQVRTVQPPVLMVHVTEDDERIDAWQVLADTRIGGADEEIEVRVQQSAGQLVYVDDLGGVDGTERLLSDAQFESLQRHRDGSLTDRWVLRNALAAVAAVAIAALSSLLATRSDPLWSTR